MSKFRVLLISIGVLILLAAVAAIGFNIYHSNNPIIFINSSDGTICIKENSEPAISEWIKYQDDWYYFGADKYMVRGITTIDGIKYSFSESGKLRTGWVDIRTDRMYINEDHSVCTGWTELEDEIYYFDNDGVMITGKVSIDDTGKISDSSSAKVYCFSDDGTLLSGWLEDDNGGSYYVNQDGTIASGLVEINNNEYMLDDKGYPITGWQTSAGDRYYYNNKGNPVSGVQKIKGSYYTFDNHGKLITKDDLLDSIDEIPGPAETTKKYAIEPDLTLRGFGGYKPDSSDIKTIEKTIEDIPHGKTYGFIMINLYNGKGIAYNPDQQVYSASCIKGPYIAALVNYKPELLDKSTRSLEEVLKNSDNKIYSSTRSAYGREFFADWCEDCRVSKDVSIYHYPHISARELAKLWIQNYYFFNTDETGMKIRDWYTTPNQCSIYHCLGRYDSDDSNEIKPLGYRTESKAGWISEGRYFSTTDGGIIYPDDTAPYIIAIISDIPSNLEEIEPLCLELNKIYKKTLD